jgi:ubiquitin carboxyl-terminal hydrolase 34
MASDHMSVGVSIVGDDPILIDPIHDFPFHDPEETTESTVERLANYLSTRELCYSSSERLKRLKDAESPIDEGVVDKVQQWLERYLRYIRDVDQQSAIDSCRQNLGFWVTFPEIFHAMACRKYVSRFCSYYSILIVLGHQC